MSAMQRAYAEEMLSGLFLIAGFVADAAGYPSWALACWIKAGWDTLCSFDMWRKSSQAERAAKAAEPFE